MFHQLEDGISKQIVWNTTQEFFLFAFAYLFNHLFTLAWTHRYLFYAFGYNPKYDLKCNLLPQILFKDRMSFSAQVCTISTGASGRSHEVLQTRWEFGRYLSNLGTVV